MNKVHYSSKSNEWETPQEFFDKLNLLYHFDLDACASKDNAKCAEYFSIMNTALDKNWLEYGRSAWMNPPYGRQIGLFVRKAAIEARKGCQVVCLLPARTDTAWFHEYCTGADEIFFLKGRLKFGNPKNSAPFPSMVVIFRPAIERRNQNNQAVYTL
jgi:site-specific DNA-methyltransferase (adenine-specific)